MSRTDDEIRADLAEAMRYTHTYAVDVLLNDMFDLLAERDAALAVIARVTAWRDELARNPWDARIAPELTRILDTAAT